MITVRKPNKQELEQAKTWPVWSKAKSTFPWEYDEQETCYIIKGKAVVKSDREEARLGPGDYVIFPKGLKCTWTILEDIEKHYKFG
jgi:uncharacterized cupin superfamily protein